MAAQSYVSYSFEDEFSTINTNLNGTHYVLSSIRRQSPDCRFYFAGSSEMFGHVKESPQNEETPFHPRSPYGISKMAGFELTRNYREAYGLFTLSGMLFNHESPRRGGEFVTRKISNAVARIKNGLQKEIKLGNKGIAIMAVDNLPSELPIDSSEEFGNSLISEVLPYLINKDDGRINRATTASNGKFCSPFNYLKEFIK